MGTKYDSHFIISIDSVHIDLIRPFKPMTLTESLLEKRGKGAQEVDAMQSEVDALRLFWIVTQCSAKITPDFSAKGRWLCGVF